MGHEDPLGPALASRLVTGLIYARALWLEELPLSPLFVLWEWAEECLARGAAVLWLEASGPRLKTGLSRTPQS